MQSESGKRQKKNSEGIGLPNQERIKTFGEKKNYKYWGILEADTKQAKTKDKNKKEVRQTN